MRSRLIQPLLRFFGWWGGLFALLGGGWVCPCCGTPTCPGGAAAAGLLGALVAVLVSVPRQLWQRLAWAARRGLAPAERAVGQNPTSPGRTGK